MQFNVLQDILRFTLKDCFGPDLTNSESTLRGKV